MFYRLILLFLLCASNIVWSANGIAIIDDVHDTFNIAHSAEYFIDEEQRLSFRAISSNEYAQKFRPVNGDYLQFGLIKGNIWIRTDVTIRTVNNLPSLLEINAPRLQYLDIYLPNLYGDQIQAELGNARPYRNRDIHSPNYLYSIPHNTPPVFTVYMRLSSHLPVNAQIELKTLSAVHVSAQKDFTLTGLYIGLLCTLLIGNIFFFFKSYRPMYLIYSFLLLGIVVLHLSLHDQVSQFFPNAIGIQERLYNLASLLCVCAMVFFSRAYLDTKRYLPRIDKLLVLVGSLNALLAIVFATFPELVSIALLSMTVVVTLLLLTVHAIIAFAQKIPFSGYYLIARLVLLTGHFSWILAVYGIIPSALLLKWGLTSTIIIEALIHFMGMMVKTTQLLQNRTYRSSYLKAELFDFLSDFSGRLRRQVNIIDGGLSHLEKNTRSPMDKEIIENSRTANYNLQSLIERISYLHDIEAKLIQEQMSPVSINQLVDKVYNEFQLLDQDNALIELNTYQTDQVEILHNAQVIQKLLELIAQELKHYTGQTLTLDILYHSENREGITHLEIRTYPVPSGIHLSFDGFDFGISHIAFLVQQLSGKIQLIENAPVRTLNIVFPIHTHTRQVHQEIEQESHFDISVFGQEDEDLQKILQLLQNYPIRIEHFSTLESLTEHLDSPDKRTHGKIILVLENGGYIPHITQQKIQPLMRLEDQCLLISNNVKMSVDYAKKIGFDDILSCAELDDQLATTLSRLIRKGNRLRNTPLSRINSLRKNA